jgi:predicted phosphodiesterase
MKILYLLAFIPFTCSAFSVGIISDIHAGSMNSREAGRSIVYPRSSVKYFEMFLKKMRGDGVSLVISLGDNTQSSEKKYYKRLKAIENKYKIKVLWVKGNHDGKYESILGPNNFVYDKDNVRFIGLNTTDCPKNRIIMGCLSQTQKDYLENNKNDNTIILQHHPNVIEDTCEPRDEFSDEMGLKVLAGHYHQKMSCEDTRVFPALTEHKNLNYSIIEL